MLCLILAAYLSNQTKYAKQATCVRNLKELYLGFRMCGEASDRDPPVSRTLYVAGIRHQLDHVMSNLVVYSLQSAEDCLPPPKFLICPSDSRAASQDFTNLSNENISYFLGVDMDDTFPESIVAGDRNIHLNPTPKGNVWTLGTNKDVSWSKSMHGSKGNIVRTDGTVTNTDTPQLKALLVNSDRVGSNRVAIPIAP